jgi:hypothetical protein
LSKWLPGCRKRAIGGRGPHFDIGIRTEWKMEDGRWPELYLLRGLENHSNDRLTSDSELQTAVSQWLQSFLHRKAIETRLCILKNAVRRSMVTLPRRLIMPFTQTRGIAGTEQISRESWGIHVPYGISMLYFVFSKIPPSTPHGRCPKPNTG